MVINEHGIKCKITFTVAGGTSLNRGVDHLVATWISSDPSPPTPLLNTFLNDCRLLYSQDHGHRNGNRQKRLTKHLLLAELSRIWG